MKNRWRTWFAGWVAIAVLSVSGAAWAEDPVNNSAMANIFVTLSKKMVPTVVNIFTTANVRSQWGRGGDTGPGGPGMPPGQGNPHEMWRRFFEDFFGGDPYGNGGPDRGSPMGRVQSLGSGFIIEATEDGVLILTNNHVIDEADEVKVKFTESLDEKETPAQVVGRDPDLDIAVLKVKTKLKLTPAVLGDSDKLEQGEWVLAVGNPFGHGHSVSKGIVSAKERTLPGSYSQYLQVDAPINPGNSGGPLANLNGEVVGINNAILANAQGIGFAIPINLVKRVLPELKTKGHVERGYIGINIEDLRPQLAKGLNLSKEMRAPIVTNVVRGGPADKAGIRAYDVILDVNGKAVKDTLELVNRITSIPVGETAQVKVLRQGKERTLAVKVAQRPTEREERRARRAPPKPAQKPAVNAGMQLEQIDDEIRRELGKPESFKGVIITDIQYGGPADQAGLSRGDIILEVDRKPIKTVDDFYAVVKARKSYLLRVKRPDENGQDTFAVVSLNLSGTSSTQDDQESEEE